MTRSASPDPAARHDAQAVFNVGDEAAYQAWRARKLADYPRTAGELMVEIRDPRQLSRVEHAEILRVCAKANMAIYVCRDPETADKDFVRRFGAQFGLQRLDSNLCADEDSITSLQVMEQGRHTDYIPYTNKPLNWHTDGYYNTPAQRIRAFIIHCAATAAQGGANAVLDCEIAYILLRDANPEFIAALQRPGAMTIPPNVEAGVELRAEQGGPVFSVDPQGFGLHMRYTARKRNIRWAQDAMTLAAVGYLERILNGEEGASRYIFTHRLEAGQGIISNNVLHNRAAFEDDAAHGVRRLLYRARYYDRIACGPWVESGDVSTHVAGHAAS